MTLKKSTWDMIFKVIIGLVSALLGAVGGNAMPPL